MKAVQHMEMHSALQLKHLASVRDQKKNRFASYPQPSVKGRPNGNQSRKLQTGKEASMTMETGWMECGQRKT